MQKMQLKEHKGLLTPYLKEVKLIFLPVPRQ